MLVFDKVPTWLSREDYRLSALLSLLLQRPMCEAAPLLQGWPASHPAVHLSPMLHLCHHTYHNEASLNTILYFRNGLLTLRHHKHMYGSTK